MTIHRRPNVRIRNVRTVVPTARARSKVSVPRSVPRSAHNEGWVGAKLHLGCGTHRMPGWINIDGIAGPAVDVVMNFAVDTKNIPDGVIEKIYWCHGPEHVYPDQLLGILRELRRVMRASAKIMIATIDLTKIYENRYLTKRDGSNWNSALYGEVYSTDHPYLSHKQCFTEATLSKVLADAGFCAIRPWSVDQHPEIIALRDYATQASLVTCYIEGQA